MPSQFLVEFVSPSPSEIVWADTTDFSVSGVTRTDQIDLTGLTATSLRQGAKADLGENPADEYICQVAVEFGGSAPTVDTQVVLFIGFSDNDTAGTLNPGGLGGSDAAYTGQRFQLDLVGVMPVAASGAGTVQRMNVGFVRPLMRYAMPVILNNTDQSFDTDAITMYVRLTPRVLEAQ